MATLRSEERLGLAVALAGHVALAAWLVLAPAAQAPIVPFERTEVTLTDDVSLTSTAPDPADVAAAQQADQIGDAAPAPQPAPVVVPAPAPVTVATTRPVTVAPAPAPVPMKAQPAPAAKPQPTKPAPAAAPPRPAPSKPTARPGAARVGSDFLKDVAGTSNNGGTPAAAIGPAVRSSLAGAISRQLKPHWSAPQGVDAELLVTLVRFRLNRDGSLAGTPEVVSQSGQTAANAAQVKRHAEQAIRAVRLAAPFDLPDAYYAAWQVVTSRFDRRLSQ